MLNLCNGQQRECSKQNFHRHFLHGSNLNNNTGLKQRHLTCVLSNGTSSSAPQGDGLRIAAQTLPSQDQCSSVPEGQQHRSCPAHQQHCSSASVSRQTSTDEASTVGEIEPPTDKQILEYIAERIEHYRTTVTQKSQNYGDTRCNKERNFCTNDITFQSDCIMPKSNSVACHPALPLANHMLRDRQSLNHAVTEQRTAAVVQALEVDSSKGSNVNADLSLNSKETGDCTTSAPEKHSEYQQIMIKVEATCTKNEDESPVVPAIESRVTLDELTEQDPSLTLNRNSSQEDYKCPQLNINTTLDDTNQVPDVCLALAHMTEKEKRDTGQKPREALGQDNVQDLTDVSKGLQTKSSSVVSENKTFELASLLENQNANTKKRKPIEDQQYCGVTSKDVIAHSKLNSVLTSQSEHLCNQTSREGVRENAVSVPSQTDLSIVLSENKVKERAALSASKSEKAPPVNILKNPLYEDISDDEDVSQLAKTNLNTEELSFPACLKDPQYEDISEDENSKIDNASSERPSLTQVPECYNEESPFENKGYGRVQGQAQMKTEISSEKHVSPKTQTHDKAQHYSCLCLIETDEDSSCPKCGSKRHVGCQTNHSVSCSPSSFLKNEDEDDGQMEDDWIVIPISISDLTFEPEDEDQDDPEKDLLVDGETGDEERQYDTTPTHRELHWPAPTPVSASDPDQIEMFDTVLNFVHAKAPQFRNRFEVISDRSQLEYKTDSEGEPHKPQNRRESFSEPEDSCDTEDSCDYSSGTEHNYLTVSRQLLKERSEHLPPETDDSVSENEGEDNEVTNVRKGKARSLCKSDNMQKATTVSDDIPPKAKGQNISKGDEVIILDSDTEDENQNYKKKPNRKRLFSSCSDPGKAPCVQQKRLSPETMDCGTVTEKFQNSRLPSADSPAPQRQSTLHHTQFEEVGPDADSDLSHVTEKCGQLIETKAGSGHVQYKTNRPNKSKSVIILDSDTEDESDQIYRKKASRKRLFSSGSEDSGDAPCVQQNRHSLETVDRENGTAKEELQETRLSSLPRHQSKLKSRHLIKAKGCSEYVKHKTIRQTTLKRVVFCDSEKVVRKDNCSKKKSKTKNILSSGFEDSDSLFTIQNRPGNGKGKPEKNTPSEGLPEKQLQSVDKVASSNLSPNPRLVVHKSSYINECKLAKESRVYRQDKDETQTAKTPTATRKRTDSCEMDMRHFYRNKKGKFVSKPKPANGRDIATKSKVSRHLMLPSQEGPSTSIKSSPPTGGKLSKARQRSASSRALSQSGETSSSPGLTKSKQNTSLPRHHLSSSNHLQRPHNENNPSTSDHLYTPTKGPSSSATMQSTARKQVIKDWQNSFFPTRRDRKTSLGMEDDLRTTNHHSVREDRPGSSHYDRAPRQRHNSHDAETPLMKKTKIDAIQWTKAINRDAPREQRYSVGEGYKWSEKPTVAKPTKGPGREGMKY